MVWILCPKGDVTVILKYIFKLNILTWYFEVNAVEPH